jgi:hypothetical protein
LDATEGGWISLRPAVGHEQPGIDPKAEETLASEATEKRLLRVEAKADESPEADDPVAQISGEWARAAVFEVAGGEPMADTLASRERQIDFAPMSIPSSSSQTTDAAESDAGDEASPTKLRRDGKTSAASDVAADVPSQRTHAEGLRRAVFEGDDWMQQAQLGAPLYDRASHGGLLATPAAVPTDEVLAAAFDELGGEELELAAPASDYLRLNSWLSGTPLLLIFALDRVTARRSRPRSANDKAGNSLRRRMQ